MTTALCAPARCREVDPDLWHSPAADDAAIAKSICNRCEVRESCLEVAMTFPDEDQWGVWGGIDAAGRRALRASDPDRYPVRAQRIELYSATREERYGRNVPAWGEKREGDHYERPPVDWAADALEANVLSLMDRYENETETGYGLTGTGETVYLVNDIEFAA